MAPRATYPRLNNRHNLRHFILDLKYPRGTPDQDVYKAAAKHERLVITRNQKDFMPLAKNSKKTGVILIAPDVTDEQVDVNITALLTRKRKHELYGCANRITQGQVR